MNMDRYKKTIKKRIYLLSIPMILAVAFGIYNVFFGTAEIKNNYIFGFQDKSTCLVIYQKALFSQSQS